MAPVTRTRAGAPEFEDLKPCQIITEQSTFIDRNSTGYEWVIFNKQVSGFYRVNYDDTTWNLITRALRSDDRTIIHEYNWAQIVNDVFELARAKVMAYNKAFNILSFLEFEDAYAPWTAAIDGFNFIVERVFHDADILTKLQKYIVQLSAAITARLGFYDRAEEPFMDSLLRMYVMQFLCNNGYHQCVETGKQNFQRWRKEEFLPANMRPWVYCVGLREGTAADFEYFWNRYLREDLANEIVVMLQTAGCTSDQASLERFLNATMAGDDIIRAQDLNTALNAVVTANKDNTLRVFKWLKKYGAHHQFRNVNSLLSNIASRLLTEKQIKEFELWVTDNRNIIGEFAFSNGINGARNPKNNLKWFQQRIPEISSYFKTNYVEDDLED